MKKKLIIAGILASSVIMKTQEFNPPGSPPPVPVFRDGQTGFGMFGPPTTYMVEVETKLPNDGVSITQLNGTSSCLHLNNMAPGGQNYYLGSTSSTSSQGGGHFIIHDNTTFQDRFIIHQNGNAGIGTISPMVNKLEVFSDSTNERAGLFTIMGQSTGGATRTGVRGFASISSYYGTTIGVDGEAWHPTAGCCGKAMGVRGNGRGAVTNYGGYFTADTTTTGTNYGVYAKANNGAINWAGYFQGNVNINGLAYCSLSAWSSDKRFKKNINTISSVTSKLMKIKGYTYEYKTDEFASRNFTRGEQIGFIAQELKEIFPQLVVEDKEGYNYVNYLGMIPLLLEGFKEQVNSALKQTKENEELKNQVASLQKQLEEQQQQINEVVKMSKSATNVNSIANNENVYNLSQNEPNPFSGETQINYNLPEQINKAYLVVYDLSGKQITTFPITQKGSSSITITSEKLAAGIYIYSVIADGKMVDSKRMIVTEK